MGACTGQPRESPCRRRPAPRPRRSGPPGPGRRSDALQLAALARLSAREKISRTASFAMGATKCTPGRCSAQPGRGARRSRPRGACTSPAAAAGQKRDDLARVRAGRARHAPLPDRRSSGIASASGWPTNSAAHVPVLIKLALEGQQAQHEIHRFVHRVHAALPPRPNLRTHVLHGRNPCPMELRARRRLVSGASMPTNTSGRAAMKERRSRESSAGAAAARAGPRTAP